MVGPLVGVMCWTSSENCRVREGRGDLKMYTDRFSDDGKGGGGGGGVREELYI